MTIYLASTSKALIAIALALALFGASLAEASTIKASTPSATATVSADRATLDRIRREIVDFAKDLGFLELSIASLEAKIEASSERFARSAERFARAKAEYDERYSSYEKRLIALYKARDEGALPLIMSSKSIRDMALSISAAAKASADDALLVSELKEKKLEAEAAKKSAEEEKASLVGMRAELEKELADLRERLERAADVYRGTELLLDETRKREMERIKAGASLSGTRIGDKPTLMEVPLDSYSGVKFLTTSNGPPAFRPSGKVLTGVASWYGNEFNGRPTANGEIFNEEDFTAASKEFPFGTYLAVTYRGRGVIVRVNDRGPYVKGRFLDLSKGAAKALGLGLGEVKAEIVIPIAQYSIKANTS